jgi:hypothetical protein
MAAGIPVGGSQVLVVVDRTDNGRVRRWVACSDARESQTDHRLEVPRIHTIQSCSLGFCAFRVAKIEIVISILATLLTLGNR